MNRFLTILTFFRLVDEQKQLSISNIAVMLLLGKIMLDPTLNLSGVAAILTALSAYNYKRYLSSVKPNTQLDKLEELDEKVSRIEFKVGMRSEQ